MLLVAGCGSRRSPDEIRAASVQWDGDSTAAGAPYESGANGSGHSTSPDGELVLGDEVTDGNAGSSNESTPTGRGSTGDGQPGNGNEIVVATVGNYSGIPGVVYVEAPKVLQAWAQTVNQTGGINGHPVRMIVRDDGSDPAQHLAIVRELVEKEGVVALLSQYAPLTGDASVDYLTKAGVPVVGGEPSMSWWKQSPVFFPQTAAGDHQFRRQVYAVARLAKAAGQRNVGVIVCAEASGCADASNRWQSYADEADLHIVYTATTSVASPDYTSECLAARNRDVEIIMATLDGNSLRRLAASCARQGYRPMIWTQGGSAATSMQDDPNLQNFKSTVEVYPFFLRGVPGARAMHAALDARLGTPESHNIVTNAWLATQIFELAASRVDGRVTSAALLAALNTIEGETFGELSPPLTYRGRADTSDQQECWYNISIEKGAYVSSDNAKLNCV